MRLPVIKSGGTVITLSKSNQPGRLQNFLDSCTAFGVDQQIVFLICSSPVAIFTP